VKISRIKANKFPNGFDAVEAAPESHKVLLENSKVRVVEVVIKPLQKEPMHHHKWPSVMIVDSSTKLKYYDNKKKVIKIPQSKSKFKVEWMKAE
jgi:hypothetical protein